MKNKNLQLNLERKSIVSINGVDKNIFYFTASTESVDRAGDKILLSAWELDNFKAHPIILFQHDSYSDELENVLGSAYEIFIDEKEKKLVIGILFSQANEKGALAEAMLLEGHSLAVSVGFIPKKSEIIDGINTITEAELLEVSVVKLPCNQDATQIVKSFIEKMGLKNIEVKDMVEEAAEVKEETPEATPDNTETPEPPKEEATPEAPAEETPKADDDKKEDEVKEDEPKETPEAEAPKEAEETDEVEVEVIEDEDDEEIEVEVIDDDEEILDLEIEVIGESEDEVDNSNSENDKSMLLSKVDKEGRTLSAQTLQNIAEATALAKESITSLKGLISTLDNLVSQAGGKTLEDGYITLKVSDFKELREDIRESDKSQAEALAKIKRFLASLNSENL